MRPINKSFFLIMLCLLVIASCKKETGSKLAGTSALTIVNGMADGSILTPNFTGTKPINIPYNNLINLSNNTFIFYNSYSGLQNLGLFQVNSYPDTTISRKPVFNLSLKLPINTIHKLFLMGTLQTPDQLFTTDELPYHYPSDSVMAIRFINISGGDPVSINMVGNTLGSEVQSLPYKGITAFKNFNASSAVSSYTFEFRDSSTGALLGSYEINGINTSSGITPNPWLNQNFTIAFLGTAGGNAPNRVLLISEDVRQ